MDIFGVELLIIFALSSFPLLVAAFTTAAVSQRERQTGLVRLNVGICVRPLASKHSARLRVRFNSASG